MVPYESELFCNNPAPKRFQCLRGTIEGDVSQFCEGVGKKQMRPKGFRSQTVVIGRIYLENHISHKKKRDGCLDELPP